MEIEVNPNELINELLRQIQQLTLEIAALRTVLNQGQMSNPAGTADQQ